ncbi:MAG: hypothetical protein MJH11_00835 [Lentisphaeria bacterium]|nr:hypothetical protein [Lentisphaeria bacterium]
MSNALTEMNRQLEEIKLPVSNDARLELRQLLSDKIAAWLERSPEHLFTVFYQLDLGEEQVSDIFKKKMGKELSDGLADMVINRQIQRLETYQNYIKEKEL